MDPFNRQRPLQLGVARQILKRAFFVFIKKMAIPDLSHNELAVGLQMGLEQRDAITAAIMDRNIFLTLTFISYMLRKYFNAKGTEHCPFLV
jgi:hypothetical protein